MNDPRFSDATSTPPLGSAQLCPACGSNRLQLYIACMQCQETKIAAWIDRIAALEKALRYIDGLVFKAESGDSLLTYSKISRACTMALEGLTTEVDELHG